MPKDNDTTDKDPACSNDDEKKHSQEEVVQSDEETIASLKESLEQSKQDYLLSLAELENARKRIQKEKHDSIKFAQESIITDFLTPLDNFENALGFAQNMNEEMKSWAQGFSMILEQFKDVLNQNNIHPFNSEGQVVNPHLHEVIEMESTTEMEPGIIIQEFTKGYKSGDRILRPARVKVSKAPAEENLDEQDQIKEDENLNKNKKEA